VSEPSSFGQPGLARLAPYPFQRLRALLADSQAPSEKPPIALSIGEPQHPPPAIVADTLGAAVDESLGRYPASLGRMDLRETMAKWLCQRFALGPRAIDPATQVLPAAGTREALFAVSQALLDPGRRPLVLMPNPFYQIYEGAALLAGGEPVLMNTTPENGHIPDLDAIDAATWARCGIIYICTPSNPGGQVLPQAFFNQLLGLRERYGFVIASDECYSELYRDERNPPLGLLQACQAAGYPEFNGCLVFHSLSKRSNLPGLRSGLIAGDAALIAAFAAYRTYQGSAMPLHHQQASLSAWADEAHVKANRAAYRQKFAQATALLQPHAPYHEPEAGFYVWLPVPDGDDEAFSQRLYQAQGVTVLPGRYLSRPTAAGDPGAGYVRLALVAEPTICEDALERIQQFLQLKC